MMLKKLSVLCGLIFIAYHGIAAEKPNIILIMADDVGIWNISAYHRGMMGGSTPNIDPRWTPQIRPFVDGSKPAISGRGRDR